MGAAIYPGLGAACNGCGQCCIERPCGLARDFAGVVEGPCPCLIRDESAWRCGLVVEPHRHVIGMSEKPFADAILGPMFAEMLGVGKGCDADLRP